MALRPRSLSRSDEGPRTRAGLDRPRDGPLKAWAALARMTSTPCSGSSRYVNRGSPHAPRGPPRVAIGFVGSSKCFFPLGRTRAASVHWKRDRGEWGAFSPCWAPSRPPPLFVAAGESPLSRRKRGRSTNLRVSRRATAPPTTTPPRFLFLRHHTRRGDGSVKLARGAFGRALCGGRDAIQTRVPVPTRAWRTYTPRHQAIARDRGAPTRVFPSPRPEIARGGVDPLCFTAPKSCM